MPNILKKYKIMNTIPDSTVFFGQGNISANYSKLLKHSIEELVDVVVANSRKYEPTIGLEELKKELNI